MRIVLNIVTCASLFSLAETLKELAPVLRAYPHPDESIVCALAALHFAPSRIDTLINDPKLLEELTQAICKAVESVLSEVTPTNFI